MGADLSEQLTAQPSLVTLLYAGWQVWDGQYRPVRVGGDVIAPVEFVQRSTLRAVESGAPLAMAHLNANRYSATAEVRDVTDAVVLDLGSFRALRWIRPGENAGDFQVGTIVSLELTLNLNAWEGSTWTRRVADRHGTDHRWHVKRILRLTNNIDDATDIEEATMETVDSALQYCLLECSLI